MADRVDDYDDIFGCCSPICSDICFDDPKVQDVRAPVSAAQSEPEHHETDHKSEAESALKVLPDVGEHQIHPDEMAAAETENKGAENKSSMEIDQKEPSPGESGKELMLIAKAEIPDSRNVKKDLSWLPPLWVIEKKARMKGRSKGIVDTYYISPDGHRCRSKTEVRYFCECGPSKWRNAMKRARDKERRHK